MPSRAPFRVPVLPLIVVIAAALLLGLVVHRLRDKRGAASLTVRVLGCSPRCQEGLGRRLRFQLEQVGFAVSLSSFPSEEHASWVARETQEDHFLTLSVTESSRRESVLEGRASRGVRLTSSLRARTGELLHTSTLEVQEESADEDAALFNGGLKIIDATSAELSAALLVREPVQRFVDTVPRAQDIFRHDRIARARQALEARRDAMAAFATSCEAARTAAEGDARCVTAACGEEYLLGVLANGDAVVQVDPAAAIFPIGSANDVGRLDLPERIEVVSPDGARRTVSVAGRYAPYGGVSRDGRFATVIERAENRSALVMLDLSSGARWEVLHVDAPARIMRPQPSPDGSTIAFVFREFTRDDDRVMIVSARGGTPTEPVPFGRAARFVEVAGETLLAVSVPEEMSEGGRGSRARDLDLSDVVDDLEDTVASETLPKRAHLTIVRLLPTLEVVARIGGVNVDARALAGAKEQSLFFTTGDRASCGVGRFDLVRRATTLRTAPCLGYPTLVGEQLVAMVASMEDGSTGAPNEVVLEEEENRERPDAAPDASSRDGDAGPDAGDADDDTLNESSTARGSSVELASFPLTLLFERMDASHTARERVVESDAQNVNETETISLYAVTDNDVLERFPKAHPDGDLRAVWHERVAPPRFARHPMVSVCLTTVAED